MRAPRSLFAVRCAAPGWEAEMGARVDFPGCLQAHNVRATFGDKTTLSKVHVFQAKPVRGAPRDLCRAGNYRTQLFANLTRSRYF